MVADCDDEVRTQLGRHYKTLLSKAVAKASPTGAFSGTYLRAAGKKTALSRGFETRTQGAGTSVLRKRRSSNLKMLGEKLSLMRNERGREAARMLNSAHAHLRSLEKSTKHWKGLVYLLDDSHGGARMADAQKVRHRAHHRLYLNTMLTRPIRGC